MLLASKREKTESSAIFIDIGTNTEITLAKDDFLTACSTASGPAFEGAHIADGMRAVEGAIEKFRIATTGKFEFQTVGNAPPVGICGSGVLDIVAELLKYGILSKRGALEKTSPRVRTGKKGLEVLIVNAEDTGHGRDIVLTRKDISEIQLAKGAIRAGIELLMQENHILADEINKVIIAGAFGTYLDIGNSIAIGLFPDIPRDRFVQIGNAAGVGAKMTLLSKEERLLADKLAGRVNYLELAGHPDFTNEFAKAMMF